MGIDQKLRKEQAGFRSGRGTTEQIFISRSILEQVNEWQVTLYINFVDFEKAFDSTTTTTTMSFICMAIKETCSIAKTF